MFHYLTLDEAFLHLYTTDLDRLDSRIARHSGLNYAIDSAMITRKDSTRPVMFLAHHTYARMTQRTEWNWPYKTVLAIEKGNSDRLLSEGLRELLETHIPGVAHLNGIAMAEYNRTRERLYPTHNALMRNLVRLRVPQAPLLSNFSYNLQVMRPAGDRGVKNQPKQISETPPLNDLAYGMYQLTSVPLQEIGKTYAAAILNWDNQTAQVRLRHIQPGTADGGLYLDFHSEIHRFLAEVSVHPSLPLSQDPLALSVKIGSYGKGNELVLTPVFSAFRERLKAQYDERNVAPRNLAQNRTISPQPSPDIRRGL